MSTEISSTKTISLFISYCHEDESYVEDFLKYAQPLINSGVLEIWYDRKNHPGSTFQKIIDKKLVDADIVFLFITASFLSSKACDEEMEVALKRGGERKCVVVPVIVKKCGWLDIERLKGLLALPIDGQPINDFDKTEHAYTEIYNGLKETMNSLSRIKYAQKSMDYLKLLNDAGLLTKSHPNKEKLKLDDIFTFPDLYKFSKTLDEKDSIKGEDLIDNFLDEKKMIISGESQSGKSSLVKEIVKMLERKISIIVYVKIDEQNRNGLISNNVKKAIQDQYVNVSYGEVGTDHIIPIIDDFQKINNKERAIRELHKYPYHILVVDEVFSINIQDELITSEYVHYRIKEFSPSLRHCLIEKWNKLGSTESRYCADDYESLDHYTELIDSSLGKIIGEGIVPSYPFFILSILSTSESIMRPLDQEITSQGYCYQSLIYISLRRQGVRNDEIDTYLNFLTEFARYIFFNETNDIPKDDFKKFVEDYHKKFNLSIPMYKIINNLEEARVVSRDSFNNYRFTYVYIYYFFAAKYLAENIDSNIDRINSLISNLHKNENAYIVIFISHHSKNQHILDEIVFNAISLFEDKSSATLSKSEIDFFDAHIEKIIEAALPPVDQNPEEARKKSLSVKDSIEEEKDQEDDMDEEDNELELELRRAIKTVEVMGRIIKNRSGSLEKEKLEMIFESGMNVLC